MRRRTTWRTLVGALALALAAALPAERAYADPDAFDPNDPSTQRISLDNAGELAGLLRNSSIRTIVLAPGEYAFGGTLQLFRSRDLVICSSTGDPADVTITLGVAAAVTVLVDQVTRVTFRGITIENPVEGQTAVLLRGVEGNTVELIESFVDGVTFDRCVFRASTCLTATSNVSGVAVDRCRMVVTTGATTDTGTPGEIAAAVDDRNGILWDDGEGLLVHRTRIETTGVNDANGGIVVQGTFPLGADGDRVSRLILVRNKISGAFDNGMQLVDLREGRIRRNQVTLDGPVAASGAGRVGILIQRSAASRPVEGYEIRTNRIRRAHTGVWLLNTRSGLIGSNRIVRCGDAQVDARFGTFGGGLLIQGGDLECRFIIRRNRFSGLRSPAGTPATTINLGGVEPAACFPTGHRNTADRRHPLF